MHSAICVTSFGVIYSIDVLSIGVGVDVFLVYVHSAICETYLVLQYSIDLLSLKLWWGRCILSICAFCYM